jgi:hypothetical protein
VRDSEVYSHGTPRSARLAQGLQNVSLQKASKTKQVNLPADWPKSVAFHLLCPTDVARLKRLAGPLKVEAVEHAMATFWRLIGLRSDEGPGSCDAEDGESSFMTDDLIVARPNLRA